MTNMRVKVLFFASAREAVGKREEEVDVEVAGGHGGAVVTLAQLRETLCAMYPAARDSIAAITLALNLEYATDDAELHDGDEVALIPPISGG
ncbi:hypothetical protein PybrP1_010944 [[Pythium] brassicae (nom. inval.)]|nr:hypothetical protein PybrP1_010944 [[Pythium] brassicae (nom. inval.)]